MAQKVNLVVDQGSDFLAIFTVSDQYGSPMDFTGYSAISQIRKHYTSSNSVTMDISLAANGDVTMEMSANTTALLEPGRYVYDIEVTSAGDVRTRIVEGIVTVTPEVTR